MGIEDLLKGILGGATGQGAEGQQSDMLGGLLESILGGGAATPQGGQQSPQQEGGLSDLIGSILGGGTTPQSVQQTPQQGGGLPDLIGSILGGGQAGGGLGGILGGILGGGGMSNNAILAPITQALSERLGLTPQMAQAVVLFAVSTVIPALIRGVARKRGAEIPAQSGALPSAGTGEGGLDLDDLLQRMGTGQKLGRSYLQSTGLVQQLSEQTGLDRATATKSLQQTFSMLGGYLGEEAPETPAQESDSSKGLDSLLDTWDSKR